MNGQFIMKLQLAGKHIVFLLSLVRRKVAMMLFYLSDLQIFLKVTKCNVDQDIGKNTYLHCLGSTNRIFLNYTLFNNILNGRIVAHTDTQTRALKPPKENINYRSSTRKEKYISKCLPVCREPITQGSTVSSCLAH